VRIARGFVEEKLRLVEELGQHLGRYIEERMRR
jgi:hypothetical protein